MSDTSSMDPNNTSSSSLLVNKSGRKGDPRMHRAVTARLANPNLTLFEALQMGGFGYEHDDDATAMDQEQVTLGQRKNQLSRRLRLARKQQDDTVAPPRNVPSSSSDKQQRRRTNHNKRTHSAAALEDPLAGADMEDEGDDEGDERGTGGREIHMRARDHPDFRQIILPQQRHSFTTTVDPTSSPAPAPYGPRLNITNPFNLPLPMATAASMPTPSGVAVAALVATAQSMGMTLEQLALSLSQCKNLANLLTNNAVDAQNKREILALHLYQSENQTLYTRAMLLAGYNVDEATEGSPRHMELALKAWQAEGKRLQGLVQHQTHLEDPPMEARLPTNTNNGRKSNNNGRKSNSNRHGDHHQHDHHSQQQSSHSHEHAYTKHNNADCEFHDGRHVHRLEGCGHQAIIHQPEGGAVHIDFVVGDKVECYQDVYGQNGQDKPTSHWPSQYKCDDLHCEKDHSDEMGNYQHSDRCLGLGVPRSLDLSNLDLQGKEWSTHNTNGRIDEPLLGLFKLSDSGSDLQTIL